MKELIYCGEIKEEVGDFKVLKEIRGRTGDRILHIENKDGRKSFIKERHENLEEMVLESKLLMWLEDKSVNTPEVQFYKNQSGKASMVISAIPGESAHEISREFNIEKRIRIIAKALKEVHNIEIALLPGRFSDSLGNMILEIKGLIEGKRIDREGFLKDTGKTLEEAYEFLIENKVEQNKNVMIHGDYCVPNVIIEDEKSYGVIDWGNGGAGDVYMDLYSIRESIKRNFGEEYLTLFFESYGVKTEEIQEEKMEYYDLVDKFYDYMK